MKYSISLNSFLQLFKNEDHPQAIQNQRAHRHWFIWSHRERYHGMADLAAPKKMLGFLAAKSRGLPFYHVNPNGPAQEEKRETLSLSWRSSDLSAHFKDGFLPSSKQWSLVTLPAPWWPWQFAPNLIKC